MPYGLPDPSELPWLPQHLVPRRPRVLRTVAIAVASMLGLQALIIAVLSVVAHQRKRRSPASGFPHLDVCEISVGENRLQLYDYGRDLYDAMLEAIDDAKETIYLESFIWKGDAVGQEFRRRLGKKAAEGVEVYVIFDTFGNLVVPPRFKRSFHPRIHRLGFWGIRRPWHLLDPRRYAVDHHKLLVVDGNIGFVGGYNLGSVYATQWRDTHLRVVGPAAMGLAQAFVDFWNRFAHESEHITRYYPRPFDPTIQVHGTDAMRLTFPIRNMYIDAIDRAQDHIYLTNAYFVPDHVLLESLAAAARRGVDVQVLLPWVSNHVVTDWAARGYFTVCLDAGIRIFGYRGAMIHAKTCTIDGQWSTVGTANLDRLSSVGNYEVNVEIYSPEFARQMEAIFECDKTNAFEVTRARWDARPWYVKLSERILSPWRVAL